MTFLNIFRRTFPGVLLFGGGARDSLGGATDEVLTEASSSVLTLIVLLENRLLLLPLTLVRTVVTLDSSSSGTSVSSGVLSGVVGAGVVPRLRLVSLRLDGLITRDEAVDVRVVGGGVVVVVFCSLDLTTSGLNLPLMEGLVGVLAVVVVVVVVVVVLAMVEGRDAVVT